MVRSQRYQKSCSHNRLGAHITLARFLSLFPYHQSLFVYSFEKLVLRLHVLASLRREIENHVHRELVQGRFDELWLVCLA